MVLCKLTLCGVLVVVQVACTELQHKQNLTEHPCSEQTLATMHSLCRQANFIDCLEAFRQAKLSNRPSCEARYKLHSSSVPVRWRFQHSGHGEHGCQGMSHIQCLLVQIPQHAQNPVSRSRFYSNAGWGKQALVMLTTNLLCSCVYTLSSWQVR